MNTELRKAIIALLAAQWKGIGYQYENLTEAEKAIITEKQFNKLITLIFNKED